MKKICRIWGLPSHQTKDRTSGVDFVRVVQPMKHLNGWHDKDVEFETTVYNIEKEIDWLTVAKNYDIIFLNYIVNSWGYAAMGAMARGHGRKIVFDVDDALWYLKTDNPAYNAYKPGSTAIHDFTCILNDVDIVTTTTQYLKNVIISNSDKNANNIKIRQNFIDLDLYNHRPSFKNDGRINLVHFGSTTHFNDLAEEEFRKGIDRIMSEYPNVTLRMIGAFIPYYRQRWGMRYENLFGNVDIYQWINGRYKEFMTDADIVLAPLTIDTYNRAKSGIKYLEYSACSKPGVYQNLKQYSDYIVNGKNGYLAEKANDWYFAIKTLIDDVDHREKVGKRAFAIIQKYTIQKNIDLYAKLFKDLI